MAKAPPAADPPVLLSSEALRQAALQRAAARGRRVARQRLAWRWSLWGLGQLLRWAGPPAVLLGLGLAWWQAQREPAVPAAPRPASAAASAAWATAPTLAASGTQALANALPSALPNAPSSAPSSTQLSASSPFHASSVPKE